MSAQPSKSVCLFHDADRQEALMAARQAGGRAKATSARMSRLMPASLRPVLNTLLDALGEVHSDVLEPQRANAMAALASAIVRVYGAGQLEERLVALEQAAAGMRRLG
jgi:hypothetical protein